jgi:hypothetical protein
MDWHEKIYRYCERGSDPAFWAEPVNAVTNGAFIVAALFAARALMGKPAGTRGVAEGCLVALILAMGAGSFLFHTFATRWASLTDTAPIGIFMLAYLAYALRRLLGFDWVLVAAGLLAFIGALYLAGEAQCRPGHLPVTIAAHGACLNGTAGYVPALAALAAIAVALAARGHPAWRFLAAASAVFLASMTFRTVDWDVCDATLVAGHRVGTHFLWHLLNATTLYILVMAGIRHGDHRA